MDMHSQKYNPEVPTLQANSNERLHQINDQLNTLKNVVNKQVSLGFARWQSTIPSFGKWGQLI